MTVKSGRYILRRIGGRIVPIRIGAKIADGLKGVSRGALRKLDAIRNKASQKAITEFTKDSVVKGKVFHGTNANFSKFSHSKIGSSTGTAQGRGFYFTDSKFNASAYGKKIKEFYLKMKNPMMGSLNDGFTQKKITMDHIDDLTKGQDLSNWGESHLEGLSNLKKSIRNDNDLDKIQEIGQTVYHNDWRKALSKVRDITGIDGSISTNKRMKHYVAYNSDQIMKAPKKSQMYKKIQKIRYSNRNK